MSLATIKAAYEDAADYAETGSVAKAKAFATACRKLLLALPAASMQGGAGGQASVTYSMELIADQLKEAQRWINAHDTDAAPRVIHADFCDFRE